MNHRRPTRHCLSLLALTAATTLVAGCPPKPQPVESRPELAGPRPTSRPEFDKAKVGVLTTTRPNMAGADVVASVPGVTISRAELDEFIYRIYGVNALDDLAELGLARAALEKTGKRLEPADVEAERTVTFGQMFADAKPADYPTLIEQFLTRSHLTRAEFEVKIIQTNACLRKLIAPQIAGAIKDEVVFKAFEQLYGENRRIADITLTNLAEAQTARQRVASGQAFGMVAREMSEDKITSELNGEWPPFSAQTAVVPALIRSETFKLKPDEVSDPLSVDGKFHVVKLIEVIPSRTARFDDVKASVRARLEDELMRSQISALRKELRQVASTQMHLEDPTLKDVWAGLVADQQNKTLSQPEVDRQLNRKGGSPPATAPAAVPDAAPATGK